MGEWNRGSVALSFEDGEQITDFVSFSLHDNYTDPLGNFQFTIRPTRQDTFDRIVRTRKGTRVRLSINNNVQATMLIQTQATTISKDLGVEVSLECKSLLINANAGSVDPDIAESFKSDTPVEDVVLLALGPYGFDVITPDAAANVQALTGKSIGGQAPDVQVKEVKHKEAKAHEGETAYGFAARIFSRLGFALRVDAKGLLLLGSPDYSQEASYMVSLVTADQNKGDAMFGSVVITDTNDGQFSEVVVRGQAKDKKGQKRAGRPVHRLLVPDLPDPGDVPFSSAPTSTTESGRHNFAAELPVDSYKPTIKVDKFSRDNTYCETACNRVHGRNSEGGFMVECEVDGLVATSGAIWTVDTVCGVVVDKYGIAEDMWVKETTKTMDRDGAQRTRLKLIPLNSLVLAPG